ncbi:MAG: putative glycolipid-binding domain-containing protein, partial [Ilumatobacteraceae bacterium]
MNTYQSLSSSGHKASWQPISAVEKSLITDQSASTSPSPMHSAVELRWENEGWTAEGTLGSDNAQFVLRLSAGWTVQQCLLFRDLEDPDLWLGTDSHGRWGEMNGAHRTELDGCTDIDFVNANISIDAYDDSFGGVFHPQSLGLALKEDFKVETQRDASL